MTLSVVAFCSAFFDFGKKGFWYLGSIMMVGYEAFLQIFEGKSFILYAKRNTFFEMNREGILGIFGFFSIYLYSLSVGWEIYFCEPSKEKKYFWRLVKGLLRYIIYIYFFRNSLHILKGRVLEDGFFISFLFI